jgi:hypothetical protein
MVVDPFVGSGTVTAMAAMLGRRYCGIDANASYCEIARKRTKGATAVRTPDDFDLATAEATSVGAAQSASTPGAEEQTETSGSPIRSEPAAEAAPLRLDPDTQQEEKAVA